MKLIIVSAELLLFVLIATAGLHGAERPTFVAAKQTAASPYAVQQPTRVILTSSQGDETTLIYRRPAPLADGTEHLIPLDSLPIVSLPARDSDFAPTTPVRQTSFTYQANYSPQLVNANQPLVPVANCNCQPPVATGYAPTTQYAMPGYNGPIAGAPQVVYRPVAPVVPAAVVQTDVQVGRGVYGQPVIYRPGQPLRNAWRWLTP
jgi:hypothetical protein